MTRHGLIIALTLCCTVACKKTDDSPATAESVDPPVRELTPEERLARYEAEIGVVSAVNAASTQALRRYERSKRNAVVRPPDELVREDTRRVTIMFAGNNHGEREDCGCRKNPLGGLARRHTMFDALTGDEAESIWGPGGRAEGVVFHLDAGDGLYKNSTLDRGSPNAQAIARHDAKAVVAALNRFPPDAYLAGEMEFVFGLDELRQFTRDAKFPIISANIADESGELVFPPSVVVEREGFKLGVVGVTKSDTRWGDYWKKRGLTAKDPTESVATAVAGLPDDVSMVVLLSNLGLPNSKNLVEQLAEKDTRVHFVAVSGSNRMTSDPEFAAQTPIMEPLSRGKYLGRADFLVNGDSIEWRNAAMVTPTALRDYRRAVRSYWTTRRSILGEKKKIAELEKAPAGGQSSTSADAGAAQNQMAARRKNAIDAQRKRLETLQARLQKISDDLMTKLRRVETPEKPTGDDWVTGDVVPVKIEIEEERATRRILDRSAKSRPEEERFRRARPRPNRPKKRMRKRGQKKKPEIAPAK